MEAAVRALEATWATRDFERLRKHAAPDIVLDWSESVSPNRGVYRGLDEARRLFGAMLEAFSSHDLAGLEHDRDRQPPRDRGPLCDPRGLQRRRDDRDRRPALELRGAAGSTSIKIFQSRAEAVRAMRIARLEEARLYFVCEALPGGRDAGPLLDAALRGGVDIVQMREKSRRARRAARRAAPTPSGAPPTSTARCSSSTTGPTWSAPAAADGAHVGQDDVPVAEARRRAGPEALIGLSTHSAEQIEAAARPRARRGPTRSAWGRCGRRPPSRDGRPPASS